MTNSGSDAPVFFGATGDLAYKFDLGIAGRRAIVCAASKGLGKACAMALAEAGVQVTIAARSIPALEMTAEEIRRRYETQVDAVPADVTTAEGRRALLECCPDPDILVTNAGGPPAGDFRNWDEGDWTKALNANMVAPILLIRDVIDGMVGRNFGRIVNITSGAVKAPIGVLGLSNGARSGLTGFIGGLARRVAQHNVTINNLLPGLFESDRLESMLAVFAADKGMDVEEMRAYQKQIIPAGRLGHPEEFGAMCAFLCSSRSSYITAQNILIDGGAYPGTF